MAAVESPEWLPPGFTAKIKYKDGKKIKFFVNVATGKKFFSKKEVIHCASEDSSQLVTPEKENGDDNGPSSINKVEAISDKRDESAAWLPFGWTVEERKRKSGPAEGSAYKVYTDLSSGSKYYSKAAVYRHISTVDPGFAETMYKQNKVLLMTSTSNTRGKKRKANSLGKIENVDEPVPEKSPQIISMTDTGGVRERRRKGNSPSVIDNVNEPFPETSPQVVSTTNTDGIRRKKTKSSSFVTVSIERTTPADLPAGWIKEIRTSKSGSKMRTDPFYTDPVSGYMFRSKPDALRYLKTNDIRSCACKPMKRDSDDIKLNENKCPSLNPANEKLSMHKKRLSSGGEPNGGVESSGTKSPAEPKTKISKRKQAKHDSVKVVLERVTRRNSNKDAKMGNNPKSESDLSKNGAIGSPVTDPSTEQQFPESGGRNKTGSRKPKKRSGSSLPLRSSKRLAGSEPEMQSNLDLSEHSKRAAVRGSTGSKVDTSPSFPVEASDTIPQTSNIEPAKEAVDHAVMDVETRRDIDQLTEFEKPPTESSAIPEEPAGEKASEKPRTESPAIREEPAGEKAKKPPTESSAIREEPAGEKASEKPPTESSAIRAEPSGEKASEKPLDDVQRLQESQLCYDFGDSWSDPLEFALKTLRGELPIEDTLTFPGCFGEQLDTMCLKQPQFIAPTNFQSEVAPKSDSSKNNNIVDPLPASSPSLSALDNLGFSSYSSINLQPSKDVGKKDPQTKFNP